MTPIIHPDAPSLGLAAAREAGDAIAAAVRSQGSARVVLATGASQFATLDALLARNDIDWSRIDIFHLDEYIGLDPTHPASFRRYLRERFINHVKATTFHPVNGDAADARAECARLSALISTRPIDVMLLGIGENGHLAFNDPPADVKTTTPYIIVALDEACRRQQLGEGWFPTLADVPRQAISMSVRHILTAKVLIASVPDERKAEAVRASLEGPLCAEVPASYLRLHQKCSLHIDRAAASRLGSQAQAAQ